MDNAKRAQERSYEERRAAARKQEEAARDAWDAMEGHVCTPREKECRERGAELFERHARERRALENGESTVAELTFMGRPVESGAVPMFDGLPVDRSVLAQIQLRNRQSEEWRKFNEEFKDVPSR